MSAEHQESFFDEQVERRDREAVCHVEDFQGLAELLVHVCAVRWGGVVVGGGDSAPLWVAVGHGATALGRSQRLWELGSRVVELTTWHGSERDFPLRDMALEGQRPIGLLVIAPVRCEDGGPTAFCWVADEQERTLSSEQRRALEIIVGEIRLRLELRQRLVEKLALLDELRRIAHDLRASNRELIVARDRALEGERAKAAFLTHLSHEVRTPLNVILGFTEMLLEDARDNKHESYAGPLAHIFEAASRMREMIENALYVARVETRQMPLYLETFDLGQLLREVVEGLQSAAAKGGNDLTLTLAGNVGAIHADRTKVRQIVHNLVSNACKFTQQGRISVSATRVGQADGPDYVRIVVADTGPGMTRSQLEKLFEDFASGGDSSPSSGLGVGLAVANRFCKMMNGSIRVTSQPGHGSRFVVTLPVEVEERQQSPLPSSGTIQAVRAVLGETDRVAPLVLVVDGDEATRTLLTTLVSRKGLRAVAAGHVAEALAAVEAETPALITLDVDLGEEDGWALLTRLRTMPALVSVPILLVTETVDQNLAFELGASDVISKPVSPQSLGEALERWLRRSFPARPRRDASS